MKAITISFTDLMSGETQLEFGNIEQINVLRTKEEEVAEIKEAMKKEADYANYDKITMYSFTCPHCGYESGFEFKSEWDAFKTMTLQISPNVYICNECKCKIIKP